MSLIKTNYGQGPLKTMEILPLGSGQGFTALLLEGGDRMKAALFGGRVRGKS